MATATKDTTTAMDLPVAYVEPGQPLAEVFADLDGWAQVGDALRTLTAGDAQPRLAYVYQPAGEKRLLAKLVLNVAAASAGEDALAGTLSAADGLRVISVQHPAEAGLVMSERQRPQLAGTPAVIFGQPVIGGLARGIIEAQGEAGERLLAQLGHDAGRLAASALPPLLEQLGLAISNDLLARRVCDLQVIGWAEFERASIDDAYHGEVSLTGTFEAAPWGGKARSTVCHFLTGFIAGVFSVAWGRAVICHEDECQATGAATCRFSFQPS